MLLLAQNLDVDWNLDLSGVSPGAPHSHECGYG